MKFCFDIDNTLLFSDYDSKNNVYSIKGPNTRLIEILKRFYREGQEIILYTGRHWNHLKITCEQLESYKIPYHSLVMGRPVADVYIDDKGCLPEEFIKRFLIEEDLI